MDKTLMHPKINLNTFEFNLPSCLTLIVVPSPPPLPKPPPLNLDKPAFEDPTLETLITSPAWSIVLRMAEGLEDTVHLIDDTDPYTRKLCLSLRATRHFLRLPTRSLGTLYSKPSPTRWRKNLAVAVYYYEVSAALGDPFSVEWLHQNDSPIRPFKNPLFPYVEPEVGFEGMFVDPVPVDPLSNGCLSPPTNSARGSDPVEKRRSRSVEAVAWTRPDEGGGGI
ncbi:hypothetical protein BC829DRAFT_299170 [Chytridium lagenaria]|nr:hypothetical protein BC829DRAFT_299170 [Chytridium lagenaria]